ncbi:DUF6493 family protein [Spirillospora sp. NPDC052242]
MTSAALPDAAEAWSRIAGLIDARDADGVAAAVLDLDDGGRRAVAAALPGHLKAARARREPWEGIGDALWAYRAAGAGTFGGAAAVASWLNRRDFRNRWLGDPDDDGRLLDIWAVRDDAWRADLARRLALRLRGPRYTGIGLVLTLLQETGAEPPDHDPLVVGWVLSGPPRPKDPLLPALLPRVFEADGVGRALRQNNSWPVTLATMAARGDVDRDALVDGCVRRFLRGGTDVELRFFVRLHDLLMHDDPSVRRREVAARARDHVRLLPSAPGPVAGHVLDLLREIPDLPASLLAEAFDGVLFRPEAGIVRSGLSWLRASVRRRPDLADAGARALAHAFGHEKYAVQEKAVRLALALPAGTDGAPLAAAAPLLPPDLAAQVTARFGGAPPGPVADVDPAPEPLSPPRPREPEPAAPPITTPLELARAFVHSGSSPLRTDELMTAFVRLAHAEPDAVRAALGRVLTRGFYPYLDGLPSWSNVDEWMVAAGRMLAGSAPVPSDWRRRMPGSSPVGRLTLHRAAELLGAVEAGALPPLLLATPTAPTGHVAPDVLADRLRVLAHAGAEPGPADLQQALLRLPPGPHPEASRRAAAIDTPAARTAARWMAAPPVPRVSLRAGEGRLPETVIDLDGLDGPLADPELDTTFPFPDDALSDADDAEPPAAFWAAARRGAAGVVVGAVPGPGMVRVVRAEDTPGDDPSDAVGVARWAAGRPAFTDRSDHRALGRGVAHVARSADEAPQGRPEAEHGAGEATVDRRSGADAQPVEGHAARVSVAAWASIRSPRRSGRARLGLVDGGPTGLPLVDAVFAAPPRYPSDHGIRASACSHGLPSHPEVAAAHLVPELRRGGYLSTGWNAPAIALLDLVPANGMFAEHVAEFLARRLGSRERRPDRLFLDLCARGDLPAAAVGRNVARLLLDGDVRPSRMIDGLERAAEAGAFADVWRVLAATLPMLCPEPGERPVPGLDRLFELGVRTARWCGARGAIPEVEALAARKGSAAYVRAARVLDAQLKS